MATISENAVATERKTILDEFLIASNSLLNEMKEKNDAIEDVIFRISGEEQSYKNPKAVPEKRQDTNSFKDRLSALVNSICDLNTQTDCILNNLREIA